MPRFFTEQVDDEKAIITGEDAKHIIKALRMTVGEQVVVCDGEQRDYQCEIESITDEVRLRVLSSGASEIRTGFVFAFVSGNAKRRKI